MPKLLVRILTSFLVPCLFVEHVLGDKFFTPVRACQSASPSVFEKQALISFPISAWRTPRYRASVSVCLAAVLAAGMGLYMTSHGAAADPHRITAITGRSVLDGVMVFVSAAFSVASGTVFGQRPAFYAPTDKDRPVENAPSISSSGSDPKGGLPLISAKDDSWLLPQLSSKNRIRKRPRASGERVDMAARVLRAVGYKEPITHGQIAALLGSDPADLLKKRGWMNKYGIEKGTLAGELINVSDVEFETAVQLIAAVAGQEPNLKDVLVFFGVPPSEEAKQTAQARLEKLKRAQRGQNPEVESGLAAPMATRTREAEQASVAQEPLSSHIQGLSTLGARCTLAILAGDADLATLRYGFTPGAFEWTVRFMNPQDSDDTRWFRFVGPDRLQRIGYRMVFGDGHENKVPSDRYRSELLDFLIAVANLAAQTKVTSPWLNTQGDASLTQDQVPLTAIDSTDATSRPKRRMRRHASRKAQPAAAFDAAMEHPPNAPVEEKPARVIWKTLIEQVKRAVLSASKDEPSSQIVSERLWILERLAAGDIEGVVAEARTRPPNNRLDGTILALALYLAGEQENALRTITSVLNQFKRFAPAMAVHDWLAAVPSGDASAQPFELELMPLTNRSA